MVEITGVLSDSPASKTKIQAGDKLLRVNKHEICDLLDYRFYTTEKKLILELENASKKTYKVKIKKEQYDDVGLEFATYLMDSHRSCKNKCMFCFIDQLPKGMRPSLYFKDDDSRLSFLFGNYITLTNLTEAEINRIIAMHISPINISVHTTNPELRVRMMKNPHAGEVLSYIKKLADGGIKLNCQLVLCHGENDGEELKRTMEDLAELYPAVESIAAVPVGVTKYREGLEKVTPFDATTAAAVVDAMEAFGDKCVEKYGDRLFYPSDEFYLLAGREIPELDFYGSLLQLENGVGMLALLKSEFYEACEDFSESVSPRRKTLVTGSAAYPFIKSFIDYAMKKWHNMNCNVVEVKNDFFGHTITTAGLLTGQDVVNRLKSEENLGTVVIPSAMLNSERTLFLDDMTPKDLEKALSAPIEITDCSGADLLRTMLL